MNKPKNFMNLFMFGNDKSFFEQAFEEAYPITEQKEVETEVTSEEPGDNIDKTQEEVTEGEQPSQLSKEEIKRLYEEFYGTDDEDDEQEDDEYEEDDEHDENTQSAIELYKYLEQNPHLIQAMRDVDSTGYEQLNNLVPDEVTKKINSLESYIQEQKYEKYINGLKNKYSDFDEDEVLKYAEKHDIVNLDVAYKAMKSDTSTLFNAEEERAKLREEVKKELMEELKNNSIQTQSIVGGVSQKPINNNEEVQLSAKEQRVAKAMGMSFEEYAKYR